MNILMVDDEATAIQILQKAVNWEKIGIQKVYTANSAMEAQEILTIKKIDITLCDIEMPKESGLDLIKWIQGLHPEIINIILTGFPEFNYARSAISLGVYQYLLKPVSFQELEEVVQSAVHKIEQERVWAGQNKKAVSMEDATAIEKVKKYLEEHYNETITRKNLEELVHLSSDHLNREFKKNTGYTIMGYIQYYRILVAKDLLTRTDKSIMEISIETGFESPAYFSKVFRKWTDMTPHDYRRK